MLSQIARIYDPIGLLAAFVIRAKILMQELWQTGVNWDDDLPPETKEKYIELFREMEKLSSITFPRNLLTTDISGSSLMLWVFSDAS